MNEAGFNLLNYKLNKFILFLGLDKNKFVWVKTIYDNERKVFSCAIFYGLVTLTEFMVSDAHLDIMVASENLQKYESELLRSQIVGSLLSSIFKK